MRIVDTPLTGTPPPGLPRVTPVPVPLIPPVRVDRPTVVALPDALVGFLPDSAELRDPRATDTVLRPYADALAVGRVRAELTGTTSSAGDEQGRLALSRDRAATIARLLVRSSGSDPALVISRGVGTHFAGFRPDRGASGALDPVRAAANRQVIVALFPR